MVASSYLGKVRRFMEPPHVFQNMRDSPNLNKSLNGSRGNKIATGTKEAGYTLNISNVQSNVI